MDRTDAEHCHHHRKVSVNAAQWMDGVAFRLGHYFSMCSCLLTWAEKPQVVVNVCSKETGRLNCTILLLASFFEPSKPFYCTTFDRNHFFVSRFVRGFVLKMKYFGGGGSINSQSLWLSYFKSILTHRKIQMQFFELVIWGKVFSMLI